MFILKSYEVECSVMFYGPKTASVKWSPKASQIYYNSLFLILFTAVKFFVLHFSGVIYKLVS